MPTRAMEQRHHAPAFQLPADSEPPLSSDELRLRSARQVGLLKQEAFSDHDDRCPLILGSKFVASPQVEQLKSVDTKVVDRLELMQPYKLMDQKIRYGPEHRLLSQERHVNQPAIPWRDDQDPVQQLDLFSKPLALFPNGRKAYSNGSHYENGLFSSSLPDIFDKKLRITSKNGLVGQPVEKDLNHGHMDDEPFELTEEIEAQTIGNLLPDDDDLLSGVLDDVGYPARANNRDDIDDDIFYTGGGMELEADENNRLLELTSGVINCQTGLNILLSGEHSSRTLFVKNINSNVVDSEMKFLFEQYGDIQTLYTACKDRGFVMISYYDIRSAESAMKALHNKPFRLSKLDIHYSIPKDNPSEKDINQGTLVVFSLDPSVTKDYLHHIFGSYGEIKEIHEILHKDHHKSIEFYDVRAAKAALNALSRSDIAGKEIKLDPSCLGGNRRLMRHMPAELEQEELGVCRLGNPGSVNMKSITSTRPENGMARVLHPRVQTPTNQFRDGTFLNVASTTTQSISSPVGIATVRAHINHSALGELSHSLGKMNGEISGNMNYGFQGVGAIHPHSLPEFPNGQSNIIPYNLSTIPPIGIKSNSRTAEGMDSRHLYKGGSGNLSGHSSGHTDALGFSRTGSCPLHGRQLAWNNSNNIHQQPSSPMLWPSSRPFINNMPSRHLTQVHGISRASRLHENVLHMNHHVGSAPAVNPSIWDRRHGYAGELMETPGFHPRGTGSMGFPGSPHLRQLELNNVFPQTGGNCVDPAMSPVHIGSPSPQQRGHMFHGRSHMVPLPSSFDSPGERMRSRRNESNVNQSDNKKHYELDIERIVRGEDPRSTLMIKNIPNKYTSKMLLAAIDENHKGTYDFIYLPIDFKNKCNVGYAFINIINPEHIIPFYKTFNGKRWEKFNSEKVASLAYARIQGKSALIAHFQNSSLMNEDKRCRPILFHSDGPNAGDQEPFPVGTNIRSRSGRSRILSCEENHHDILSSSANGGTPPDGYRETSVCTRETEPATA